MLALIGLFILALAAGVVIGAIALAVALVKALVSAVRRQPAPPSKPAVPLLEDGASGTDAEFLRMMLATWPDERA